MPLPRITSRCALIAVAAGAIAACGCAMSRQGGPWTSWRITDPPWLSPYVQPRPSSGLQESARPLSPSPAEPSVSDATIRQRLNAPDPAQRDSSGPKLNGIETDELTLLVSGPQTAAEGELVSFRIEIANPASTDVAGVVVECEFDAGLEFPGRTERRIRQPIDLLKAGEKRSISLSLEVQATGQQCARFSLLQANRRVAERQVCLECSSSPLELSIVEPDRRSAGDRAEYIVTLANRTPEELDSARITVTYDVSLVLREASAGASRTEGQIDWDLGTLRPDERVQIQLEFECSRPNEAACVLVTASAAARESRSQCCLRVDRLQEPVSLEISDVGDPVAVGDVCRYRIVVRNHSAAVATGLVLELTLPESLTFQSLEAQAEGRRASIETRAVDGRLVVERVPDIAAQQEIELVLSATADAAGTTVVEAELFGAERVGLQRTGEWTVILPAVSSSPTVLRQ